MPNRAYSISNLLPSDSRWLEANIHQDDVVEAFAKKVAIFLNNTSKDIASLDTVWCTAMQLRPVIKNITDKEKFLHHFIMIDTQYKEMFLQGLASTPFNPHVMRV